MYRSQWAAFERNILAIGERVIKENPEAWAEVKIEGQKSRRFINLFAAAVAASGLPCGVNLKRGGPDVSLDVLAFPNESGCKDATGTFPGLELRDVIGAAESRGAHLAFGDATQKTIDAGVPGGWQAPSLSEAPPVPEPAPGPSWPSYEALGGDAGANAISRAVEKDYQTAGFPGLDGNSGCWLRRTDFDFMTGQVVSVEASIEKHKPEWRAALNAARAGKDLPPVENWGD